MGKINLFIMVLFTSILFIGCGSSHPNTNNEGDTEAMGDWPVYDIEEMIKEVDLIAFVTVESIQALTGDENQDSLDRKASKLRIKDIAYSENKNKEEVIELSQAVNFVEQDKSYLLFLNKRGDYYYVTDGNSVIPEQNGIYQVNVSGIEGEYDRRAFIERIEEVIE